MRGVSAIVDVGCSNINPEVVAVVLSKVLLVTIREVVNGRERRRMIINVFMTKYCRTNQQF